MLQRLLCKLAGLPVAPPLKRDVSPWGEQPLKGRRAVVLNEVGDPSLGRAVQKLGAELLPADAASTSTSKASATKVGKARSGNATSTQPSIDVAVVTFLGQPTDLASVNRAFELLQLVVRRLSKNGRVLVLLRDDCEEQLAGHMAMAAFVRSVSKELGPKGSTINIVITPLLSPSEGGVTPLLPCLAFFLSDKSTYITGQVLRFNAGTAVSNSVAPMKLGTLHRERVVLVTGAARGIGRAIANAFLLEGATVVLVDRDPAVTKPSPAPASKPQSLGAAAPSEVGRFIGIIADISTPSGRAELLAQLRGKGVSTLDTVVHNAGITRDKTLANMTGDQWRAVLNVNMLAIAELNKVLPFSSENSSVAFISSQSGLGGNFGQTNYAATKGALMGWTREISRSGKHNTVGATTPDGSTVAPTPRHVICIAPGFIETQMTAQMPTAMRLIGARSSALLQGGKPEDVANAVCFFTSPLAIGFSGECVRVCGGNVVGADSAYLYSKL